MSCVHGAESLNQWFVECSAVSDTLLVMELGHTHKNCIVKPVTMKNWFPRQLHHLYKHAIVCKSEEVSRVKEARKEPWALGRWFGRISWYRRVRKPCGSHPSRHRRGGGAGEMMWRVGLHGGHYSNGRCHDDVGVDDDDDGQALGHGIELHNVVVVDDDDDDEEEIESLIHPMQMPLH